MDKYSAKPEGNVLPIPILKILRNFSLSVLTAELVIATEECLVLGRKSAIVVTIGETRAGKANVRSLRTSAIDKLLQTITISVDYMDEGAV